MQDCGALRYLSVMGMPRTNSYMKQAMPEDTLIGAGTVLDVQAAEKYWQPVRILSYLLRQMRQS